VKLKKTEINLKYYKSYLYTNKFRRRFYMLEFIKEYGYIILVGIVLLSLGGYVVIRDIIGFIEERRNLHHYIYLKDEWQRTKNIAEQCKCKGYSKDDIDNMECYTEDEKLRIKTCMNSEK